MDPPFAVLPIPTVRVIAPDLPFVASPLITSIEPELPRLVVPLEKVMDPLTPLSPASAVARSNEPEVVEAPVPVT